MSSVQYPQIDGADQQPMMPTIVINNTVPVQQPVQQPVASVDE